NDGGILAIALHVVRHVDESGNRPLTVAAGIVHEKWLNHVVSRNARHQRMRNLSGFAGCQVIDPGVVRSVGAVVEVEHCRPVARERRLSAAESVYPLW